MEGDARLGHVGRPGRSEGEGQPVIDDPEARRLDALTEGVRSAPVAGLTSGGALLGEGDDLGWDG